MHESFVLNQNDQDTLLGLARDSIKSCFTQMQIPEPTIHKNSSLIKNAGVFVTLKKQDKLRGCIGRVFTQEPLWKSVISMAKASAFQDRRFPPLSHEELKEIRIEISVLSPPVPAGAVEEIEIGNHGIIVTKGMNRGLFLPQVPEEQVWNREEYVSQCCRKAGLDKDAWRKGDIEIEIFTAVVFSET